MVNKIIVYIAIALWRFPDKLIYSVLFLLPKHRLVLLSKLVWQVRKTRFEKKRRNWRTNKVLSGQELSKLFAAFRTEKYAVLFKIQYIQALRPSEALSLCVDKIYWHKKTAEIYDYKKETWTEIDLHPKAFSLLKQWVSDNLPKISEKGNWVFFGEHTDRLTIAMVSKRFREARKRAALPDWCCSYALRHTRLNQLYDFTKDWRLVAEFGRHTPETCFRYYMHANNKELKKAVCTLPVAIRNK